MAEPRVLVIAGVSSGVGKTTVTLGLLAALRRRGLVVQSFKVGPDFIDPGFHAAITGRPAYSLDGWMCSREAVIGTAAAHARDADVIVVEGMMGCFDGYEGKSDAGSTAEIARWLGAPVVLVVDAGAIARSAAAVVLGFERFDAGLRLAAVIFNRVGGARHAGWLRDAVAGSCRASAIGFIPSDPRVAVPERHLGLVTAAETDVGERGAALADLVETHVDLDALLSFAAPLAVAREIAESRTTTAPLARRVRIGVARDRAFQFYYPENLERLVAAGAELVFWSPLDDGSVPAVDGLYLGGGYPELHAEALTRNESVRRAVRAASVAGLPIYAECGGLMYLADALEAPDGRLYPMVGVLPATVRLRPMRLALGYAEVQVTADTLLGPAGIVARGHEFHCSWLQGVPASVARVYRLRSGGHGDEDVERRADAAAGSADAAAGFLVGRTLMSYVHLHFSSSAALAPSFVDACASS